MLLWLWHRLAAAAPIRPLAWERPYATCVALKSKNKQTTPPQKKTTLKNSLLKKQDKTQLPRHPSRPSKSQSVSMEPSYQYYYDCFSLKIKTLCF